MADVLACSYRFVRERKDAKEGEPTHERVVLNPGDKASNLPQEVKKELKDRNLIVDEKLLDPKNKQRIPGAVVPSTDESTPTEPTKTSVGTGS